MTDTKRMAGKRVLVTGSGTGIGREIALEFARNGADVVLHYSHSADGAVSAVEEIQKAGGRATAFPANFVEVGAAQRLAADALGFLGGLDVLVNNAGITMNRRFEEVTPEQFDTVYQVNVRAQFFLTQALLSPLTEASGSIINLTSIHAFEGMAQHSVYAGTKGAIVAYTRELSIELAPRGVRVNAIAPGSITVENYRNAMPGFNPEDMNELIPCGFAGQPIDIARIAVFLASDDARFIIGQTLVVDGGTTSWMPFSNAFRDTSEAHFGKGYVPGL